MPPSSKPAECLNCDLYNLGTGFAPPEGPKDAWALIQCEALGAVESQTSRPLMGDAGGMFTRLLTMLGWAREDLRIINTIQCRPQNDWFDERAPWYRGALSHCAVHRDPVLAESHKVIIPMGAVALKTTLDLHGHKKIRIQDFHGTASKNHAGQWVVPTFHPSFLQRGAHNLIGTVIWDLLQAKHVADYGVEPDPATLIIDPPIDWFTTWVDTVLAAVAQNPTAYLISVDVETPDKAGGKDEGEITTEDRSYQILRVNVACHPDEGITVPFYGPYIDQLKRLLSSSGVLWLWNKAYDVPRLIAAGVLPGEKSEQRTIDLMWLAHFLQSDLPRGLGFWAPFYSRFGPWKHLSDSDPARYGAIDGLQNHRCGFGIVADLIKTGQYAQAIRHVHALHSLVLAPAQQVGVRIDRTKLLMFKAQLATKLEASLDRLQECYPQELLPVTPEHGLTARPLDNVLHIKASAFTRKGKERKGKPIPEIKQDLYKRAIVIERIILKEVLCCKLCGEKEVTSKHRCRVSYTKKDGTIGWKPAPYEAQVSIQPASVTRWFWQEPFNPDSWQQVLAYIKFRGHKPGKAKKTHKDSTNRETLEKLERTGDPFYRNLLDYRAVGKVKGTYVDGTERRLDDQDRVHPVPTFKPSTGRLSYIDPNITNVVADKGGVESLAAGFRHCVVAGPGCRLLEVDFSGIEAVETGAFARDPAYTRLAKLGVHAGLASYVLKRPYDLAWSDQELARYFKEIKDGEPTVYDRAKRFIHGKNYGLTLHGMVLQFPQFFPTLKIAASYAEIYRHMAPNVENWQRSVRELAQKQHYLGGSDHPFGYKHWFWSVHTFKRLTPTQYYGMLKRWKTSGQPESDMPVAVINGQYFKVGLGEDGKRCLAFFPQSTAAGVLKEALLRLFDPDSPSYIGDAYFGQTPLRAPIHDSILLEVPFAQWDRVYEAVCREMLRPIAQQPIPEEWGLGPYLTIGVAAKAGADWGTMENLQVPTLGDLGVSGDSIWTPAEEDADEEDVWGLQRIVA